MVWLTTKMWAALLVAALLGVVLGWALRGIGLKGRMRRATAERDLAIADRNKLREEVDALYAGQSRREEQNRSATTGGQELQVELERRDARLKSLNEELARSRRELDDLQAAQREQAARLSQAERDKAELEARARSDGGFPAGAVAGAVPGGMGGAALAGGGRDYAAELTVMQKTRDELDQRNRYLESRVKMLEEKIVRQPAPVAELVMTSDLQSEKSAMIAQMEALEAEIARLKGDLAVQASTGTGAPEGVGGTVAENVVGRPARDADTEQELARLRWRNRYLESRLDYLEGSRETMGVQPVRNDAPSPAASSPAPEAPAVSGVSDAQGADERSAAPAPSPEPVQSGFGSGDAVTVAAPDDLIEPVEPERFAEARGGQPDDLQRIEGVGPLMERALNQLGIWHYDQVSGWSAAEAVWIENQIGFKRRVRDQDWVRQARHIVLDRLNDGTGGTGN